MSHGSPTDSSADRYCTRGASCQFRQGIALLAALVVLPACLLARYPQGVNPERGQGAARRDAGDQPERPGLGEGQRQKQQHPGQGGFFQRLRELPPEQQRRIMQNNPQFQRLPPERQEMIRERLRDWNEMTPQEKERVRQREEIFQGLSQSQKQEARRLFPQYRDLPPGRRQAVLVAFRHLRDLPPDQRQAFLDSQHVREQFSPHERDILDGLNKLLPNGRAEGSDDPEP